MADSAAQFRPAPGTPLVDIPNLMGAIGIADEKAKETAIELQSIARKQGENTAAQAAASRAGTLNKDFDTPASILFTDTEQLKADTVKQAALANALGSTDGSVNVMNILIQDIRNTGMKMRDVNARLAEDKAVSLWDDPLTAIANAFTIPWTEQELSGLAQTQADARKTLNDLTASVTNVAAAAEAGKAKVSAATIVDRQRAIAEDLNRQALQIEAVGMKDGIASLKLVQEANQQTLERVRLATAFYNDTRTQARADEHLKMERERMVWQRQAAQDAADARKDKAAKEKIQLDADIELFTLANVARVNDGLLPYGSVGELKSKMTTTAAERAKIEDFVERGRRLSNARTAGTYRYGATATEAMAYLRDNQLEPTTAQQRSIVEILLQAESEEKKIKDSKGTMGIKDYARKYVKENIEVYKQGDGNNPNAPVTFEALQSDPTLRRNALFQRVIAPKITAGNAKLSAEPNQVFSMVTDALVNESVNPAEATALIKYIYDKSTELNNKNTQIFKYLGYAPEKLVTTVDVGIDPRAKAAVGIAAVGTTALVASGAVVPPLLAAAGALAGVGALANMNGRMKVDTSSETSIQLALTAAVMSKLGFTATKTGPGGGTLYPTGSTGRGLPPTLESTRIMENK